MLHAGRAGLQRLLPSVILLYTLSPSSALGVPPTLQKRRSVARILKARALAMSIGSIHTCQMTTERAAHRKGHLPLQLPEPPAPCGVGIGIHDRHPWILRYHFVQRQMPEKAHQKCL